MSVGRLTSIDPGHSVSGPVRRLARNARSSGVLVHDLGPMQEATDIPDLFAALADAVVIALRADACLLSEVDDDGRRVRDVAAAVAEGVELNRVVSEYHLDEYPATKHVMETGESYEVSVSDPDADLTERELLLKDGFARLLMCRLSVEGRPVGLVEVFRVDDRPFRHEDPQEVALLCTFAAGSYARINLAAKLEAHYTTTMEALVSALEARDPYTEAHAGRIRDMSMALSRALAVPLENNRAVRLGAILHDVGKIGIRDSILLKPGPLTEDEWDIMRTHPEIGERMLTGIDFLSPALPVIRHHHERWDGRGYPDRLRGEEIPLGARIVSVCDAFDAMTSDRPYRPAMSVDDACEEIVRCAGKQFDPDCASLLVDVINEVGDKHLEERFVRFAS
jgi:HD-GYP domain-containing protein (c-di-GMP phosphodiesterase class II)